MLYSKEYITESTLLGIWKIEEKREELLSMLQRHEWVQNIHSIKSKSRVLEILATRVLFKELLGEEKEIHYSSSGKPFLTDGSYHISVSHTKGYVGIVLNEKKFVGLDLEQISKKIYKVRERLISPYEYIDKNNELIHLLLHWSAKEAMIKFLDINGINIRRHLFVDKFTPRQKGYFPAAESRTETHYQFDVHYKVEPDFVMVCLEANDF
jgi:phosphopantetheinyl transferase